MNPKKPRQPCPICTKPVENLRSRFCSNQCQMDAQYRDYIQKWKAGTVTGNRCAEGIQLSGHIRRYLVEKRGERCQTCGWGKRNESSGRVPLTVSHIDGDWRRTTEDNLELLCPNCHSLTPTYGSLNTGRGRPHRPRWPTGQ